MRELENLARRLAALYPQETISAAVIDAELSQPTLVSATDEPRSEEGLSAAVERHLATYFASFGDDLPPPGLYHRMLREIEHPLLTVTLAATRGNQIRAADLLGRQPQHPAQEDPRPRHPGLPRKQLKPRDSASE